jgi:2-phospho-L-lactate/phosphoenolpyruvate guanylyltransferase
MWVLLPVKCFAAGKSRLGAVLSGAQRAELTCCMLEDVLSALRRSPSVEKVMVLSNEAEIDDILTTAGVERIRDSREGDLNLSLMAAAAALPVHAGRVLFLPSDVPAVSPRDIEAMSDAHTNGLVLCPASLDGGTNALLSSLPLGISLRFGSQSLVRHLETARCRGVGARVLWRRGLARDLDRSADLEWFAQSPYPTRTRAYLRSRLNLVGA